MQEKRSENTKPSQASHVIVLTANRYILQKMAHNSSKFRLSYNFFSFTYPASSFWAQKLSPDARLKNPVSC